MNNGLSKLSDILLLHRLFLNIFFGAFKPLIDSAVARDRKWLSREGGGGVTQGSAAGCGIQTGAICSKYCGTTVAYSDYFFRVMC